jgi:integrase
MATAKLTKRFIDALEPGPRRIVWDTEVVGLGLRVEESGTKTFLLTYRTVDGRQRKPALGRYGTLTLQQARDLARQWLAEVAAGGDPSQERQEARRAPTVAEVAQRYMAELVRPHMKPTTVMKTSSLLRLYVLPALGEIKVTAVTQADVERLHREVGERYHVTANQVVKVLSAMFNACERWGLRPEQSNPCRHVRKFRELPKHRPLTPEELGRLAEALADFDARGPNQARAVAIIRLLIFTGARSSEIAKLRWTEVDLEHGVLRLGDSKTGPRVVPLNSAAREVLRAQKPEEGNPYVFPGARPGQPRTTARWEWWSRVRERAGLSDVRVHDLRHNFAAMAAADGLSLYQIGQLLGHRSPVTTNRYADMLVDPRIRDAERVGEALAKAMGGGTNDGSQGRCGT